MKTFTSLFLLSLTLTLVVSIDVPAFQDAMDEFITSMDYPELYRAAVNQDSVWDYLAGKNKSDLICGPNAVATKNTMYRRLASIWALDKRQLGNLTAEALNIVGPHVLVQWKNCLESASMRKDFRKFEELMNSIIEKNSTLAQMLEESLEEYEFLTVSGAFKRDAKCVEQVNNQRELARLYVVADFAEGRTKVLNASISDYLTALNSGLIKQAQTCLMNVSSTNVTNFDKALTHYYQQNPAGASDFKYEKSSFDLYANWAQIKNPACLKQKIPGIPTVAEIEARFNQGKATTKSLVKLLIAAVYPQYKAAYLKCLGM